MSATDKKNDHPEIEKINDICRTSPNTKDTKKVCDVVNKDNSDSSKRK